VDLDYKGLSNTGTWFIGRLQTDRDKMRVLDGLEGAAGEAHAQFDRPEMEKILAGLGSRVFLLNNVHESGVRLFETRWTLSYLAGPITRDQIKLLSQTAPKTSTPTAAAPVATAGGAASATMPVLPPDIQQYFFPVQSAGAKVYQPVIVGAAKLSYLDDKLGVNQASSVVFTTPIGSSAAPVAWEQSTASDVSIEELEKEPEDGMSFADLPAAASKAANYPMWNKSFGTWLFQTRQLTLLRSPSLDELSHPNESERDFRIRLQQQAREERDRQAEALREKYAPKIAALEERRRRAALASEAQKTQRTQSLVQSAVAIGSGVLGAFLGRRAISVTTLNKAATAARQVSRTWKETQEVGQADENEQQLAQQAQDLQTQFNSELAAQQAKVDPATEQMETVPVRLKKTNIEVQLVTLAWKAKT
jgi:hypothetical protein